MILVAVILLNILINLYPKQNFDDALWLVLFYEVVKMSLQHGRVVTFSLYPQLEKYENRFIPK